MIVTLSSIPHRSIGCKWLKHKNLGAVVHVIIVTILADYQQRQQIRRIRQDKCGFEKYTTHYYNSITILT